MTLPLRARVAIVVPVALLIAAADWGLKAWALRTLSPEQLLFNSEPMEHAIPVFAFLIAVFLALAMTRVVAVAVGVVLGGVLGNAGEMAVFGRVTDFLPLGLPDSGVIWSPADVLLYAGMLGMAAGLLAFARARA